MRPNARRGPASELRPSVERTEWLAGDAAAKEFVAVDVAIETGRGLLVSAVRAAGHLVFEINPKASNRYRDRCLAHRVLYAEEKAWATPEPTEHTA